VIPRRTFREAVLVARAIVFGSLGIVGAFTFTALFRRKLAADTFRVINRFALYQLFPRFVSLRAIRKAAAEGNGCIAFCILIRLIPARCSLSTRASVPKNDLNTAEMRWRTLEASRQPDERSSELLRRHANGHWARPYHRADISDSRRGPMLEQWAIVHSQ